MTQEELDKWLFSNLDRIEWGLEAADGSRVGVIKCHFGTVTVFAREAYGISPRAHLEAEGPGRYDLSPEDAGRLVEHGRDWEQSEGLRSVVKAITGEAP